MTLDPELRARAREFYTGVLECKSLPSPREDLDLYEFAGGFVLGLFFDAVGALPESEYLNSTWLEIKAADPETVKARLIASGVKPVEYPDPTRFFFQAPGGQVFRLAPLDGGL
jgi:hypothetical protein